MNEIINNERGGLPELPHTEDLPAPETDLNDDLFASAIDADDEQIDSPDEPASSPEPGDEEPAEDASDAAGDTDAEEAPVPGDLDSHGRRISKPYHERAYLLYGESEVKPSLDLNGTMAFLKEIGFDGGELRQARKGRYFSETNNEATDSADALLCSYCGRRISGVDYQRLPDGRLRCTFCSRTLVRTKEELLEIYKRVIANLDVFFGATIKVPVGIEFLEERKLKKKLKRSVGDIDDKSILILGLAVNNKKEYDIYLENGAPRISAIATFVHELTHIWQYTHWNEGKAFPKLTPPKRLLIYEGMAKWVEIQYLYLIGEQNVARREEAFTRNRKDEYGLGFNLYENRYPLSREAMMCNETPFKTDGYPIS